MKYITLIIGLLVAGCGKQEQADTNESTPTTNANEVDGTTAKPVKELTPEQKQKALRDSVVGEPADRSLGNSTQHPAIDGDPDKHLSVKTHGFVENLKKENKLLEAELHRILTENKLLRKK